METLGGFPNLPALWLRRAKPASANAIAVRERYTGLKQVQPVSCPAQGSPATLLHWM
jgi:hypothetical protein